MMRPAESCPRSNPTMSGHATPNVLRSAIHGMILADSRRVTVFHKTVQFPLRIWVKIRVWRSLRIFSTSIVIEAVYGRHAFARVGSVHGHDRRPRRTEQFG